MKNLKQIYNFTNKMLVSNTNTSQSTIFYRSVIYIIRHSAEGAFGLIINQPLSNIVQHLESTTLSIESLKLDLYLGGPVATNKRFFLHSGEYNKNLLFKDKLSNLGISSGPEVLKDIENGSGPVNSLIILGYSSWSSGKLEYEIENNFWLVTEVDEEIIFSKHFYNKWDNAINKALGDKNKYIPHIEYC